MSVSKKLVDRVFQIIEGLQEKHPNKPVTLKEVYAEIENPAYNKPKFSYRHLRRVFQELSARKPKEKKARIIKTARGQYWLRENLEKNIEFLKKQLELERSFREKVENDIWAKRVIELERKLYEQEQFYENILEQYEHQEILRELEKKDSKR